MDKLSTDIVNIILSYIDTVSLANSCLVVNKKFHDISSKLFNKFYNNNFIDIIECVYTLNFKFLNNRCLMWTKYFIEEKNIIELLHVDLASMICTHMGIRHNSIDGCLYSMKQLKL
jgi:hypothetical protein